VGLGAIYGESARTVGATAVSGVWLAVRMTAETITEGSEYADTAVHLVMLADVFRAAER
jgi:hypothetical protein